MHVRITKNGKALLNNRSLAQEVVNAILNRRDRFFNNGETISVGNKKTGSAKIKLVTSIPDVPSKKEK